MKFLCVDCDRQMTFEERALPGDHPSLRVEHNAKWIELFA